MFKNTQIDTKFQSVNDGEKSSKMEITWKQKNESALMQKLLKNKI